MSDRIAVMHRGRIEQVGTPGGPLRPPGDVVRRRLHRHDEPARRHGRSARGRTSRSSASTRATAASSPPAGGAPGQTIQLSVRPEAIEHRAAAERRRARTTAAAGRSSRWRILARRSQYHIRTDRWPRADGSRSQDRVSDSNPVDSVRLELVTVRRARPGRSAGRRWRSSHDRRDPTGGIDLRRGARRDSSRRPAGRRREFLPRVAAVGAATALTQLLIACLPAGSAAASAAPVGRGPTTPRRRPLDAPPRRPPPPSRRRSRARERAVRLQLGRLHRRDTRDQFEEKYGIKVNYDKFPDESTQIGKIRSDGKGGGYDVSYPASTWMPELHRATGVIAELDHSLIPNLEEPAARSGRTRPTTRATSTPCPNSWWTTGFAWNPDEDQGGPDELGRPLGREVQRTGSCMLDDHARVLRGRRVPPRARRRTRRTSPQLDQILA